MVVSESDHNGGRSLEAEKLADLRRLVHPTPVAAIHIHGGRSEDGFGQRSRKRRLFPEDFVTGHVRGRGETGVDDSEGVQWRSADTAVIKYTVW